VKWGSQRTKKTDFVLCTKYEGHLTRSEVSFRSVYAKRTRLCSARWPESSDASECVTRVIYSEWEYESLERLLAANPNASGVAARLQCSAELATYGAESRRSAQTRVPMELLLRELCEGRLLSRGGRYFPAARSRVPFSSDNACVSWVAL
jgi:hypothetical protein